MKTVYLQKLTKDSNDPVTLGTITLGDDGVLTGSDSVASDLLNDPIWDKELQRVVTATDDPERFLNALSYNYRGAYFYVTVPS